MVPCTGSAPAGFDDAVLHGTALAVVVEGLPEPLADAVRAACRRTGTLLGTEPAAEDSGSVTLVGGGPGEVDLLTLRGRRRLAEADVVVVDRLAPTAVLDELDPSRTERADEQAVLPPVVQRTAPPPEDEDDDELAAYNRYLRELHERSR